MMINTLVRIGAVTEKVAPYLIWTVAILAGLFAVARVVS
jgi:hypothetical protein